jgi:hypothetical protein
VDAVDRARLSGVVPLPKTNLRWSLPRKVSLCC